MLRRSALLLSGLLVCTLAACGGGGGGGDEDAFCDALANLSDQIADGDAGDDDGLEDMVDTGAELRENANSDQEDAAIEVSEIIRDADPADAADTAEDIQDAIGDIADDCDIDEFAEAPEEETTTTTEPEEETTTTEGGEETTTTAGGGDGGDTEVNARQAIPEDIAVEFFELAQACFDGDPVACDDLFAGTPADSVDEAYGDTCAGRIADGQRFELLCADVMTAPVPVPADVVDTANGDLCFGGDMVACDDMFRAAADGSVDQAYGGLCGGRVADTTAFCVDIFGEVALFL